MKQPMLFVSIALLGVATGSLFVIEQRIQQLQGEYEETMRQIEEDKVAIHVLEAEWSYLTQPERIKSLSKKHLQLNNVSYAQFRNIEDIPLTETAYKPTPAIKPVASLSTRNVQQLEWLSVDTPAQ